MNIHHHVLKIHLRQRCQNTFPLIQSVHSLNILLSKLTSTGVDIYFEFVHVDEVFFTRLCVCAVLVVVVAAPSVCACFVFIIRVIECSRLADPTFRFVPRTSATTGSESAGWFVYTGLSERHVIWWFAGQAKRNERGPSSYNVDKQLLKVQQLVRITPKRGCEIFRRKSCFVSFFVCVHQQPKYSETCM